MTLSVRDAADMYQLSRQAIFLAIKNNRLNAVKKDGMHWEIKKEDLEAYRKGRYSRKNLKYKGELVYPPGSGLVSIREAAKMLDIEENHMYYAVYRNRIKHTRKGCAYVLHVDDVIDFANSFLSVKFNG